MACSRRFEHIDKMGCPFEVGCCGMENLPELTAMYDAFSPKAISQGLPPSSEEQRRKWVKKLIEGGENFIAWKEGKAVGHCALILDRQREDGEYIIFVDQPYRNRGLGTELTAAAVQKAREIGLKRLWLTVEAFNFRAVRVYRKVGFQFCDEVERERTMVLEL
ncbi:MAG: GNAT family N-acetyltransferase [Desulfomonile tiedjei]|nr:GNAT family N-acetyltransferase [Desulfomonile tiedjei]